jgi:hypothetical protein
MVDRIVSLGELKSDSPTVVGESPGALVKPEALTPLDSTDPFFEICSAQTSINCNVLAIARRRQNP